MKSIYCPRCFVALLAVFCYAQAVVPSHHNNKLVNHGFGNETQCSWNCLVIDNDLKKEMKIAIAKEKLIHLVVKYENKVDDKCVNQTARNPSGNATENWQIWTENQQLSPFSKALERLVNSIFNTDTNDDERKEIRATCTLEPVNITTSKSLYNGAGSSPIYSGVHFADLGVTFETTDCNTAEGLDNVQPCINMNKASGNNTPNSRSLLKGWPRTVFYSFGLLFSAVFIHYSPAFLCFLSPTEVTEDGVCQIILEGASPVSFRSVLGNYFFSEDDRTISHKAKTFILRFVTSPLPFIAPAIVASLEIFKSSSSKRFLLVCCGFYFIQAFYISFFTTRFVLAKRPCFVCQLFAKPKTLGCQEVLELPQLIMTHLRLQPFILVHCWRLFVHRVVSYLKLMYVIELPSGKVFIMIVYLLRSFIFIFCLLSMPAVAVILFILYLLLAFLGIVVSSPIVMLCKARNTAISVPKFLAVFIHCFVSYPATFGAACVVIAAGVGTLWLLLIGFEHLFLDESLPYVACIVLVLYYLWSSYSSFTNKYQDLALALFKNYKKSRHDKLIVEVNTDQAQENVTVYYEEDEMKIPKKLFYAACEELMPIREGFCIMILKITIIVSFVFLAFSISMLQISGATPVMKALQTFLTGLFPKILAIYIDGGRQKKIEAMAIDEKIPKIVQENIKMINRTTETSRSNQGQENCGADGGEGVLLNENEDNVSLINVSGTTNNPT